MTKHAKLPALVRLSEFAKAAYEGRPPCKPTLRKYCAAGLLPARQINGQWWVDMDAYRRGDYGRDAQVRSAVAAVLGAA